MKDAGGKIATISDQQNQPDIELLECGFGTMRSSGTYIGALLQLERNRGMAVCVLVEAARSLGITKDEIVDYFERVGCPRCGLADSPMHPCERDEVRA